VAAPGPSLIRVPDALPIIAVQDAYRLNPHAKVMYGCDPQWWDSYEGDFDGELWSTHHEESTNNKERAQKVFGVRCVQGKPGSTFSRDPSVIHYGDNSGFQAINLAILFGCTRIILVGFNLRGENMFRPTGESSKYERFARRFEEAAEHLDGVEIINTTPNSALKCFKEMSLEDALFNSIAA
jgi:hypothetical protein